MFVKVLIVVFLALNGVQSAKILAGVFSPSYSHQIIFRPLWRELAKRGHDITLLTTDPMNDDNLPNLKEIDLHHSYEIMEQFNASKILSDRSNQEGKSMKQLLDTYIHALSITAAWQFNHPKVQEIIHNKSLHYDLIMIEVMYPAHLAFVDRFKAPFIGLTPVDASPRVHSAIGNPIHPGIYPDISLPFTSNLSFVQRLISTAFSWFGYWYDNYHIYPKEDKNVRKFFGNIRPLRDIQQDMSLLFVNVNPIYHVIRPYGPNTIQIGSGLHLNQPKELPKDLKKFLDESEEGVVYFSLGTNVKSSLIKKETLQVIVEAFSELPFKVLWKFEKPELLNKAANIHVMKWIPQQDVLRHPNTKLFVSQCGLNSMEESLISRVPILGLPFFGDQPKNAKLIKSKGFGRFLDHNSLEKEQFKEAILDLIFNSTYKKNINEAVELMEDVQITSLETAIWWTEYLIRHKNVDYLKNVALDFPLYQYYFLDVITFVVGCTMIVLFLFVKTLRFSYGFCCRKAPR